MTDKELQKLSRNALLEMLLEQCRENDKLHSENERLRQQLSARQIKIDQAGLRELLTVLAGKIDET